MFHLSAVSWISLLLWVVGLTAVVLWGQSFRSKPRNLMGNLTPYIVLSVVILSIALGSIAFKGLNYGLDFTGGTILELGVYKKINVDEVQKAIADFKQPELGDRLVQVGDTMVPDDEGKLYQRLVVRVTRAQASADGGKQLTNQEPGALRDHLKARLGDLKELGISSIGPTITGELRYHAFLAMTIALVVQAIYIFMRFGFQWRYGVAADIAIVHDVVIMVGLYSLAGRQIDSPFVAALLTVAGYSVMDSVVIFDRIRENDKFYGGKKAFPEVVNESVNQTMSRSVNTTLTVLITLLAIYFFGGSTLQNFAFALLVGITAGAYSSVFVASPMLILIDRHFKTTRKATVNYSAPVSADVEPVWEEPAGGEGPRRRRVRGSRRKL